MRAKKQKPRMVRASLQHADGHETRSYVAIGSPFLLDLETRRYFDLQRGSLYRERARAGAPGDTLCYSRTGKSCGGGKGGCSHCDTASKAR